MWLPLLSAFALAAPPTTPATPATTPATTSVPTTPSAPTAPAATPAPAATVSGATTFLPVSDKSYVDTVLKPHAGRVTLVNFWASYCLPCLEEMPALVKLRAQFKDDVDVVFVSTDEPSMVPKAGRILEKWKIGVTSSFFVENEDPDPFIAVVDPAWLGAIPHTVIYGRDGTIVRKLPGGQSAEHFEEAIRAAIVASPAKPAKATTTP